LTVDDDDARTQQPTSELGHKVQIGGSYWPDLHDR
jgi:hypothetical protein